MWTKCWDTSYSTFRNIACRIDRYILCLSSLLFAGEQCRQRCPPVPHFKEMIFYLSVAWIVQNYRQKYGEVAFVLHCLNSSTVSVSNALYSAVSLAHLELLVLYDTCIPFIHGSFHNMLFIDIEEDQRIIVLRYDILYKKVVLFNMLIFDGNIPVTTDR